MQVWVVHQDCTDEIHLFSTAKKAYNGLLELIKNGIYIEEDKEFFREELYKDYERNKNSASFGVYNYGYAELVEIDENV